MREVCNMEAPPLVSPTKEKFQRFSNIQRTSRGRGKESTNFKEIPKALGLRVTCKGKFDIIYKGVFSLKLFFRKIKVKFLTISK